MSAENTKTQFVDLAETVSIDPVDMEEGKWFTGAQITGDPSQTEWAIKIRSIASKRVADFDRVANVTYAKLADKDGNLTEELAKRRADERIAKVVIVDWRGLGMDRKELRFSADSALKLITDPRMLRVRAGVLFISDSLTLFKGKAVEEGLGN